MSADMDKASPDYRAFRGVWIPAEVWLSDELTLQEKVMLVEINSLQHPERGCFKSNRALAEFFQVSASRVSQVLSSLVGKGQIRIDLVREGQHVVERRIFVTCPFWQGGQTPLGNCATPLGNASNPFRKLREPPLGNCEESNTSLSNTYEEELEASAAQTPAKKSVRGTRLPADWSLPAEWRQWAQQERPGVDVDLEAAKFRDYWHAKAGAGATKVLWLPTWRNWIRSAKGSPTAPNPSAGRWVV